MRLAALEGVLRSAASAAAPCCASWRSGSWSGCGRSQGRRWVLGRFGRISLGFEQGFWGHVAPGDGPFVVLFAEHSADEADGGGAVGEDPDDVGAAAEFLVEPFLLTGQWGRVKRWHLTTSRFRAVGGGLGGRR